MRILIVEDTQRIANSIKKGLEQERYAVDIAYDGISGFDLAIGEEYDVIILDIMLPKMGGLEICQKLRDEKNTTPILILTARGQISDRVAGLNCGADDYLTKPFSFEELLARVKALTRRPKEMVAEIQKVGDLELNNHTFEVTRQGTPINIGRKEFCLLEYLMRHPNQILTKEQIVTHVWDYDADILPNTIEVYIKNLRQKIDLPFKNKKPLLKTVRGFGYKIE